MNNYGFDSKCKKDFDEKKDCEKIGRNGYPIDIGEIKTIVTQAKCSWNVAIEALKREGNILDAILSLTVGDE